MRHLLYSIDHLDMRGREPHRKCRIYYDTARFLKTLNGLDALDADVSVTARVKIRIERPGTFLHARGITQTYKAMKTNTQPKQSMSLYRPGSTPLGDTFQLAETMAKSGYFKDIHSAEQASIKILCGLELGIGPVASMMGIHIIQGKVELTSNLTAACIKAHPRYDFKVQRLDNTGCVLIFFQDGVREGVSSFNEEDAQRAKLLTGPNKNNWHKWPRNMYFARALTNGAKFFCPDVTQFPTYAPGEIGEEWDDEMPDDLPGVVEGVADVEVFDTRKISDAAAQRLAIKVEKELGMDTEARHGFASDVLGRVVGSFKRLEVHEAEAIYEALEARQIAEATTVE